MMPGMKLYNPSTEWVQLSVHGRTDLWIPPDLNGQIEPHPASGEPVKCDGIMEVRSRFLTQKDSSGKTIEGQDAFSIVSYLIQKNKAGEMGVVYLTGVNPEQDESYKAYARDEYLKFREKVDDKIVQRRREFKANWTRNPAHQGQACPPPTDAENAAIERTEARERKASHAFECDVTDCLGYATSDFAKFARHMWAAHKVQAIRAKDGSVSLKNSQGDVVKILGNAQATSGVSEAANEDAVDVGGVRGRVPDAAPSRAGIAEASAALEKKGQGRTKART